MRQSTTTVIKTGKALMLAASVGMGQQVAANVNAAQTMREPLQRYLELRGLSYTHRLPAIDPRLSMPSCSSALAIRPLDRSGLQVELRCPDSNWIRRFRFPPNGAEWSAATRRTPGAAPDLLPAAPQPAANPVQIATAVLTKRVWRTSSPLCRGEALQPQSLELIEVPADGQPDALAETTNLADFSAVANLARGTVLTSKLVQLAPVIARGDLVTLLVKGRGFAISTEVVAMESAAIGAVFKARNPETGQDMRARAEGPGRGVIDNF